MPWSVITVRRRTVTITILVKPVFGQSGTGWGHYYFYPPHSRMSKEILAKSLATCYLATCYLATCDLATCYLASGWRIWWPSFWAVAAATQNTGAGRNKKTLPVLADKGTWH